MQSTIMYLHVRKIVDESVDPVKNLYNVPIAAIWQGPKCKLNE